MTTGNLICHVFKCIAYMYSEHKMSDLPSNCQTWIEQLILDEMMMMSAVY